MAVELAPGVGDQPQILESRRDAGSGPITTTLAAALGALPHDQRKAVGCAARGGGRRGGKGRGGAPPPRRSSPYRVRCRTISARQSAACPTGAGGGRQRGRCVAASLSWRGARLGAGGWRRWEGLSVRVVGAAGRLRSRVEVVAAFRLEEGRARAPQTGRGAMWQADVCVGRAQCGDRRKAVSLDRVTFFRFWTALFSPIFMDATLTFTSALCH